MNEIVVGIDFSKSSIQAFLYSLNLARVCGCNLKLVYVSKKRDKVLTLIKDDKGMEISIEESFRKLIEENSGKLKGTLTYKILHGKIYEEITNQAKYTDAEMIVTGTHGMSGFEELWLGNNALKIISHSEKPVLSIKKNFIIHPPLIEKIVIPIDSTKETLQKVPFTLKIARYFKAQINVLSLFNSKINDEEAMVDKQTKEAMKLIVASELRYINEKKDCENVARATVDYALRRNADLISIMTEQDLRNKNIFIGNHAQQIINQSPLPVLSFRSNGWAIANSKIE